MYLQTKSKHSASKPARLTRLSTALSIALVSLGVTGCKFDPEDNDGSIKTQAQLSAAFDIWVKNNTIKGAAMRVIRPGMDLTLESGTGTDESLATASFTTDTPMRVGSITKTMTALVALKLDEAGILPLDTPVDNSVLSNAKSVSNGLDFGEWPKATDPEDVKVCGTDKGDSKEITMESLLRHRSGLPDPALNNQCYFQYYLLAVNGSPSNPFPPTGTKLGDAVTFDNKKTPGTTFFFSPQDILDMSVGKVSYFSTQIGAFTSAPALGGIPGLGLEQAGGKPITQSGIAPCTRSCPVAAPNTTYSYSQPGFIIAGQVIENVTGKTMAQLYQQYIWGPLGMTNTRLDHTEGKSTPVSYTNLNGRAPIKIPTTEIFRAVGNNSALPTFDLNSVNSNTFSAGGVITTVNDLAKYFPALREGRLLSPASMAKMRSWLETTEPPTPPLYDDYDYGLGYSRTHYYSGITTEGHNGELPGSGAVMQYIQDLDTYVIAIRNSDANANSAQTLVQSIKDVLAPAPAEDTDPF